MNESLITVIVPIYNVEAYLDQCVTSIVNQTYSNLEIILVDDGSSDYCPQICDKWANKDPRIKVVHKENGGLSSARNAGLDICTGDYISFIDSDDWLELNMYETLQNLINSKAADMAVCQIFKVKDKTRTPSNSDNKIYELTGYHDLIDHILPSSTQPVLMFQVWNKLYKAAVVNKIRFKIGQRYEDINFQRNAFANVNRAVCINMPLYNYRLARPGSTIFSFHDNRLSKLSELDKYIEYLSEDKDINMKCRYIAYAMDSILEFYVMAKRFNGSKQSINELINKFDDYYQYNNTYCNHVAMKYKIFNISPESYRILVTAKNIII